MNKIGHILVTGSIRNHIIRQHRLCLLIGSVLPDFLPRTLLIGHTWKSTSQKIMEKMHKLGAKGKMSRYSYLELGYILHYIEDYFTYPHNHIFEGSVSEHCKYEMQLLKYLKKNKNKNLGDEVSGEITSIEMLINGLEELHDKYLREIHGVENDRKYIYQAALMTAECFAVIFQRNHQLAEEKRCLSY